MTISKLRYRSFLGFHSKKLFTFCNMPGLTIIWQYPNVLNSERIGLVNPSAEV